MNKGANIAGVVMVVLGIAMLLYFTGALAKVGLTVLPSYGNWPQMHKEGNLYNFYLISSGQAYPPSAGMVYLGYYVKSLKVDGVDRTITYPTKIVSRYNTSKVAPLYEITAGRAIFGLTDPNFGDALLFSYDVSQFTGTHKIDVVMSTGFGSGGCYGYYADCIGKLTSNYYMWSDWTYSDTFTNAGPNVTVCGNQKCETGETFQTCPADCPAPQPTCDNDGTCESGETIANCPNDCKVSPICGDLFCNGNESCATCSIDCGQCQTEPEPEPITPSNDYAKYGGIIVGLVLVGLGAMVLSKKRK